MPVKHRRAIARQHQITWPQRMELIIGKAPWDESTFPSDAEAKAAWVELRDELLSRERHPATRPAAFWRFEAPAALWGDAMELWTLPGAAEAHYALEDARLAWLLGQHQLAEEEINALLADAAEVQEILLTLGSAPDLHGNGEDRHRSLRRAEMVRATLGARARK